MSKLDVSKWNIFKFCYDISSQPSESLFNSGWKAATVRVPNIIDCPLKDIFHAWHHTFLGSDNKLLHLFILIDIPTLQFPRDRYMNIADLLEAASSQHLIDFNDTKDTNNHRFLVCDIRGMKYINVPIPNEYDENFMMYLDHRMGSKSIAPVGCLDRSMEQ